jgi:hypothetical protein
MEELEKLLIESDLNPEKLWVASEIDGFSPSNLLNNPKNQCPIHQLEPDLKPIKIDENGLLPPKEIYVFDLKQFEKTSSHTKFNKHHLNDDELIGKDFRDDNRDITNFNPRHKKEPKLIPLPAIDFVELNPEKMDKSESDNSEIREYLL